MRLLGINVTMALDEKVTEGTTVHPEGSLTVCTKYIPYNHNYLYHISCQSMEQLRHFNQNQKCQSDVGLSSGETECLYQIK